MLLEIGSSTQRHAKGLNAAIEILIEQGVLIVIDARRGIGHFVAHKPDPIVSRIRLAADLPSPLSKPVMAGCILTVCAKQGKMWKLVVPLTRNCTVGSVVIHVALPGMGLTPRILKRVQVLRFREIGCTCIERCVQISDINANPVRYAVMCVASMVARRVWRRRRVRKAPVKD